MKKSIEHICKNCPLYNPHKGICNAIIILEGQKINLPVQPTDKCHWEELGIELEQIRFWVEDPTTGEQIANNGIVKIQYFDNSL